MEFKLLTGLSDEVGLFPLELVATLLELVACVLGKTPGKTGLGPDTGDEFESVGDITLVLICWWFKLKVEFRRAAWCKF